MPSTTFAATPATPASPAPTAPPLAGAGGWPLTIASEPGTWPVSVVGPDGTIYLLASGPDAQGEYQQRLVALDTAGFVKPGWPIEEPQGSHFGSLAVGPNGSVYVGECGGPAGGCLLHRFGADGRELRGWPVEVPPDFACLAGQCYGCETDL